MAGGAGAIRFGASVLHRSGLVGPLSAVMGYATRRATFPILSWHRVNDDNDPFFPSLPTHVFEQQMAFVARTYTVLPLEELADRMARNRVPRNALAITFDDGYRDNLTNAAPVLARYGLPATVFLATGAVASGEPLWFDRLAHCVKGARSEMWRTPWGEELPLETASDRLVALGRAQVHLKRMGREARERSISGLPRMLDCADDGIELKGLMLSWDDVRMLAKLDIGVGGHTVNHPILSRVRPEEAWAEISGCRAMIEAACGRAPRAFAYPNGRREDYSAEVVRMVREAGFTCAVTTEFGVNSSATPPYELRRGGPWEHHLGMFALKLAGYRLTEA